MPRAADGAWPSLLHHEVPRSYFEYSDIAGPFPQSARMLYAEDVLMLLSGVWTRNEVTLRALELAGNPKGKGPWLEDLSSGPLDHLAHPK